MPSSMTAVPATAPESMHSAVFFPMMWSGVLSLMAESWAVFRARARMPVSTPAAMTPPLKIPPRRTTFSVVQVPRSTVTRGRG